jgi:hypothetical protein
VAGPAVAQTAPAEPAAAAPPAAPAVAASPAPAAAVKPAEAEPAAERSAPVQRQISDRQLDGHTFQPSQLLLDPFLVTAVGSHTAGLTGQALGPALDWSTWPPTVTQDSRWYSYFGFGQAFDVDVRFLEHFSFRLRAGAGMYTGAGGGRGSSLVVGTSLKGTFDYFLKASWAPASSVRVAAIAGANSGPAVNILVLQGLIDSIKDGVLDPSMLAQDTRTTTYRAGSSVAWSPARALGLQAQVELLYAVTSGAVALEQPGVRVAAMADLDLLPLVSWLPLDVNATVNVTGPIGSNGLDRTSTFGLGLWYSARKEVALGIESVWEEGRLNGDLKTKNDTTWINLRYYW